MLPGRVSLYRDGTFVGSGRIPLINSGDEHKLGFGVDDAIKVKRTTIKRIKGVSGLINSSKTDEHRYRITVKNLHDRAIKISVFDQIPYSENEKLLVTLLPSSTSATRSNIDEKRGIMAWDYEYKAGEEKAINLNYRLSWPKAERITGNVN